MAQPIPQMSSEVVAQVLCPVYAPILGALGCAAAISLSCIGAAYGTAKSSIGISHVAVMHPELIMRSVLPVIMSGIIPLYGLLVDVVMILKFKQDYAFYSGAIHLGAGLSVGFAGLAAGIAIGVVGDAGVRGVAQQPRLYVGMILILIFAEVLGLYGAIVGLMLSIKVSDTIKCN
jgi:V-type H+-transporting ATPase 16kDa proteolipid subunit